MMMTDTLRYDNEQGFWEMCKKVEPEQGVETRETRKAFKKTKQRRSHIEHP